MALEHGTPKRPQRRRIKFACDEERLARRRQMNRDWMRADRAKNPEKYRKRERAHRNKPEVRARIIARQRLWVSRHPFLAKARDISDGLDAVTGAQLAALYKRQRGRCALTGRKLTKVNMQIDHIVPVSRNGARGVENLRWVCKEANEAKGGLLDTEFFQLCRDVLAFTSGAQPWR